MEGDAQVDLLVESLITKFKVEQYGFNMDQIREHWTKCLKNMNQQEK